MTLSTFCSVYTTSRKRAHIIQSAVTLVQLRINDRVGDAGTISNGNIIPANRIDPAAKVLSNDWADPTAPDFNNYYAVNRHIEGDEP
jgi:hypothetical protein